ncbi:hypothetical protein [Rossellomorea sp. FM04394]|uniref:hypothetical protein n=1 Tax=Rossellomorea sp. FM04394 TaxID=3243076 RepID=UPI0035A68E5B
MSSFRDGIPVSGLLGNCDVACETFAYKVKDPLCIDADERPLPIGRGLFLLEKEWCQGDAAASR